ncbi:hypothetical protein BCR44DRAFT_42497 [Catenaria anguillulae PL171]|uniref:Uncharacterized protein n=1 Tax=Catenaria anguillulae PL171 TaxID=765915 RepID=A0A1Y2HVG3_9FUNG|nr:hypothetical protein BCR44DRAFT_42497 [Catenaria anguillulae PL171]
MDSSSPLTTPETSAPPSARSTSPVGDPQIPLPAIVLRSSRHSSSPEQSVTPKRSSLSGARLLAQPVRTPSPLQGGSPAGSPTPRANQMAPSMIRSRSPRQGRSSPKSRSPPLPHPLVRSKSPLRNEVANANRGPVLDTDDEFEQELDHAASSDDLQQPPPPPLHAEPERYEPRHVRASTLDTNPLMPGEVVYVDRSSSGPSTPVSPPRPNSINRQRPPSSPVIALPSLSPTRGDHQADCEHAVHLSEEQVTDQPQSSSALSLDEEVAARALAKDLPFNQLSREEQLAIKRMRERERKRKLKGRASRVEPPPQLRRMTKASKSSLPAPDLSQSSPLTTPADSPAMSPVRTRRSAASSAAASRATTPPPPPPPLPSRLNVSAPERAPKRGRALSTSSLDSINSISSSSSSSPTASDAEDSPEVRHQKALARRRERDRVRRSKVKAQRLANLGVDNPAALETSFKAHNVRDETGRFMKLEKSVELGLIPVGDGGAPEASSGTGRRDRKRKHRSPSPGAAAESDMAAVSKDAAKRKAKSRRVDASHERHAAAVPVTPVQSTSGASKKKKLPQEPPASARRADRLREAGTAPAQKVTLFEAFNQIEANATTLGLRASRRAGGTVTPTAVAAAGSAANGPVSVDAETHKDQGFAGKGKAKAKPAANGAGERLSSSSSSRRKTRSGAGSPVSVSELSDLSE